MRQVKEMNTLNIFKEKLAKQGYKFIVKKEYQEKYKGGIYQKGKKIIDYEFYKITQNDRIESVIGHVLQTIEMKRRLEL